MRVKSKKVQVRFYTEMTVTSDTNGAIVFHGRMDNGECWHKALQPKDAVQVWRRMMGDTGKELVVKSPYLKLKFDDDEATWTFMDEEVLFVLDLDECMIVAWAIEKAAGIALYNGPTAPRPQVEKEKVKVGEVWLLTSSSRPGPSSLNKEFCSSLGGNASAFSSREAALDGLREFLRNEVNNSHSEMFWDELVDHGRTVDDILDEIIDSGDETDSVWMYDGTERSFCVELMKVEVSK